MEDRVQQFGRPTGASVGRCRWVPSVVRTEQPGSCWPSQARCLTSSHETEFSFRSRGGRTVTQSLDAKVEAISADDWGRYAL